jgi:hypothetical protein
MDKMAWLQVGGKDKEAAHDESTMSSTLAFETTLLRPDE